MLLFVAGGETARMQVREPGSGLGSVPAMVVDMRDHWKRYRELADVGDTESAEHLAARIIELRHRSGMLGNTALSRGFAMRAWRQQQEGKLDEAIKEFRYAVELEPAAREYRVALAGALAAQQPMNVFTYVSQYWEAFRKSFDSIRGRYLLTVDGTLWLGFTLLIGGGLWFFGVLLRYIPTLRHALTELFGKVFSFNIATLLATVALFSALVSGVGLQWIALGLAAACWSFQSRGGKIVSIVALAALWFGAGLIGLSSQMTAGMTTTEARAAFAADRFDADETVILELERRLERTMFSPRGSFRTPADNHSRVELFAYVCGLRKLGRSRGLHGIDVMDIFTVLSGTDELGRLAAVNLANIQLEREDFVPAQNNYQFAMQGYDAKPYAMFNLWRLNYERRNRSAARGIWENLVKDERAFLKRFEIEDERKQPSLIDAAPSPRMLELMINRGLAATAGLAGASIDPLGILSNSLTDVHLTWAVAALIGMLVIHLIFRFFGLATICRMCGKNYCKHCDLDPRSSPRCQACNSIKGAHILLDAELRRSQEKKIERYRKWSKIRRLGGNIVAPGLGSAWAGKPLIAAGLMVLWSSAVALFYGLDRFPRTEVLPFFSHWSFLTGAFILIIGIGVYALAVLDGIQEEKHPDGAVGKS